MDPVKEIREALARQCCPLCGWKLKRTETGTYRCRKCVGPVYRKNGDTWITDASMMKGE